MAVTAAFVKDTMPVAHDTPETERISLIGRRILIVEDETLVSMVIEEALKDLGCDIVGPVATRAKPKSTAAARAQARPKSAPRKVKP